MKKWKRKCPKCGEELFYTTKYIKIRAEKQNTNCRSCAAAGISRSEETRKKLRKLNSGKNNPMYGRCAYDVWLEKYGKEEADRRQKETNNKLSKSKMGDKNPAKRPEVRKKIGKANKGNISWCRGLTKETNNIIKKISETNIGQKRSEETRERMRKNSAHYWKGKDFSEETKLKMRLSRLKYIEKNNGQVMPNYNSDGCEVINWFNMYYGFNFQHAENGGEVCIGGYWPDGLDKKRKTIIEVDEPQHFGGNGKLKQKDVRRQKYLEGLGYKFIRVRV